MLPDFNVFSLLAWFWSEPSKAAQHSQAQCGLCLPAQVPIGQLPSMYRWHQRPPRALVPRSTRCNLHACPGIQGTRNLAKTLLRPLNVKLPLEKMLGDPSCLEVRWLVKSEITPREPLTDPEISLKKKYFWKYPSVVWAALLQVMDGDG